MVENTCRLDSLKQLQTCGADLYSQVTTRMMEERELKLEEDGVSVRMESERPHLVSLNLVLQIFEWLFNYY